MRRRYVVTYDISDAKRLRRTFKKMRDYGEHIQLSVFESLLTDMELVKLKDELREIINEREDQVLFVDLGQVEGDPTIRVTHLGRPFCSRTMAAVVV